MPAWSQSGRVPEETNESLNQRSEVRTSKRQYNAFMSKVIIGRPEAGEYAEAFGGYVGKVPGADILTFLKKQLDTTLTLIRSIDESRGNFRYEPGKWSIKELLGHLVDSERVFAYRALVFARNDVSPLPGFDQNPWNENSNYNNLSVAEIAAEFEAVRRSTILLFEHLDHSAWERQGIANNKPMTTRAAAFVIGGHVQHHLDVLNSRYLNK